MFNFFRKATHRRNKDYQTESMPTFKDKNSRCREKSHGRTH